MSQLQPITRNINGLLDGVKYVHLPDGSVDWRKMIKPEYLVPNKDKTKETDISKLSDSELIILLAGLKDLAQIRGYISVTYRPVSGSPDYFATVCQIIWTPNYETQGLAVTFEAIGDASMANTSGFGSVYLAAIAENRAFARCIRSFLKINIVSQEELKGGKTVEEPKGGPQSSEIDPAGLLEKAMQDKNITFEQIKAKLVKEGVENASEFTTVSDFPGPVIFELIDRVRKASANNTGKKKT